MVYHIFFFLIIFVLCVYDKRASKLNVNMKNLHNERLRLATNLMSTLDYIEQQSGIFLVKPMYSYKGRLVVVTNYVECNKQTD